MYEYNVQAIGNPAQDLEEVKRLINLYAAGGWRLVAVVPARYGICGIFEREARPTALATEREIEKVAQGPKRKRKV